MAKSSKKSESKELLAALQELAEIKANPPPRPAREICLDYYKASVPLLKISLWGGLIFMLGKAGLITAGLFEVLAVLQKLRPP